MESLTKRIFLYQWERKLTAIIAAIIIWGFVNHSITSTVTIPSIPLRIINLPPNQTIIGLQPNGFFARRTTLTLTGTKDVIEQLEPGDLEIHLDVSNLPKEGIVQIAKKDLVSLNPNINLSKNITGISHPEYIIKMSPLVTEKIPVTIHAPSGEPPKGYEYLDIWPIMLKQTVMGPEEEVLKLKEKGLDLTFNLEELTTEQLDALQITAPYDDEVNFFIPDLWKKVSIPFLTRGPEPLNDPEAKFLQINFLKKQFIPIKSDLPIHIFYPLKYSSTINPQTYSLTENELVIFDHAIPVLKFPLYANNVSKLFVEIVRDNIEIQIVASPKSERERMEWGIGFIDEFGLENTYVAYLLSHSKSQVGHLQSMVEERENNYRLRFREYMQKFTLFLSPKKRLKIEATLDQDKIKIYIPNAVKPTHAL